MAVDKLVDSTQLDSDLTSVANAIRTKGGTSSDLLFPSGFVQAIGNLPTGSLLPIADATITSAITNTGVMSTLIDSMYSGWEELHMYVLCIYNNTYTGSYLGVAVVLTKFLNAANRSAQYYRTENSTSTESGAWSFNVAVGSEVKLFDVTAL